MIKHHTDVIEAAKSLLKNMSSDELLSEFLELQENACGPNVYDFFRSIMLSTSELYGFSNFQATDNSFRDSMYLMDLNDWAISCILKHDRDYDIHSANDDKYHLHPQEIKKVDSFLDEECYFALAS